MTEEQIPKDERKLRRDLSKICAEIDEIRNSKNKQFIINRNVFQLILNDLKNHGTFYYNNFISYYFSDEKKKLVELNLKEDQSEFEFLISDYGIYSSEKNIYEYLHKAITIHALNEGNKVSIHRFAYYNKKEFVIYLYNNNNKIFRISPEEVRTIHNGDEGILFLNDDKAEPFEWAEDISTNPYSKFFIKAIHFKDDYLHSVFQKFLFELWFHSMFFDSIMVNKPILAILSERGTGKTTVLQMISMLLFGNIKKVTHLQDSRDQFDTIVTNSNFIAFDNVDRKIPWLNDALAVVSTGDTVKKRVLYTTNRVIDYPVNCFIGFTSRIPEIFREDVAERFLIIKLQKPEKKDRKGPSIILNNILDNRNIMMTEIMLMLKEYLNQLRANKDYDVQTEFRVADFETFLRLIGHDESDPEIEVNVIAVLKKLSEEQAKFDRKKQFQDFQIEIGWFIDLMRKWVVKNSGNDITNQLLFEQLKKLAEDENMDFRAEDTRVFGQIMRRSEKILQKEFIMTEYEGAGGGTKKRSYKIRPKLSEREMEDKFLDEMALEMMFDDPGAEYDN